MWDHARGSGCACHHRPGSHVSSVGSLFIQAFFCKYNDPQYVKIEKLTILLKLLTEANSQSILMELKEYCNEIDVDFVSRAIKAVGFCALKIPSVADR